MLYAAMESSADPDSNAFLKFSLAPWHVLQTRTFFSLLLSLRFRVHVHVHDDIRQKPKLKKENATVVGLFSQSFEQKATHLRQMICMIYSLFMI